MPLSDRPRPERLESSVDTALCHGRAMVRFLTGEAPPKVRLRQSSRDNATQHRDAAERRQWLVRQASGVLEEEFVADWLDMSLPELRRHTEAGDLIALDMDGRSVYPAFRLKDAMTVLNLGEVLSVMPIRAPWMRLEWFVTPDTALGGATLLEAFHAGQQRTVFDLARSHGAE